ncbi:hypothetical protein SETIT_2G420900v2 [Setaria italica]|uniref:RING-type domain-containing protein n=1 Tax=Setaria italica TaxID=4555 RepID=A0A368Q9J0_SETIT|nr:uncharacterized protein LOC101777524 [Setaria italica]RCV14378.1 hypothetical protein SETIT_2G420900v2 [Setaria italica]RCV14379.1 hypothetical protein SETIT_2G420900v2 [Setaria italica]
MKARGRELLNGLAANHRHFSRAVYRSASPRSERLGFFLGGAPPRGSGGAEAARVWVRFWAATAGGGGRDLDGRGGAVVELVCFPEAAVSMGRSFRDSLKVLEADIQHANSLASEFRREYDGACLQMRMAYCPAAHFFLFLVQWTDCSLAGALGLLRILIYKVYADGTTTMSTHERKASIREFYAVIFPSLMQLHEGINEVEDKKQKAICIERYRKRDEDPKMVISEIDDNIEEECGICMETNTKVVLPTCSHAMCIKCYRDWRSRSQSCPFCRDSLKRVNSADLWIYTDDRDIVDMATVRRENLRRLFMYIDKLPTVIPESVLDIYDSHVK